MTPDSLLRLGRVVRAHGVRGEMKVAPETDDPTLFEALETVYLGASEDAARAHAVESVRYQYGKGGRVTVLLAADGVADRDAAEALRGVAVFADADELPDDEEGLDLDALVGLPVEDEDGQVLGTVSDVAETPAHELLVVSRDGRPDALVPFVDAFVVEADPEAGRVVIRPIEGLFD